jgi:hypothetical protein
MEKNEDIEIFSQERQLKLIHGEVLKIQMKDLSQSEKKI